MSASTQNQALSALVLLYREVLRQEITGLEDIVRAKRSVLVPLVLSREEVAALRGQPSVPSREITILRGSAA